MPKWMLEANATRRDNGHSASRVESLQLSSRRKIGLLCVNVQGSLRVYEWRLDTGDINPLSNISTSTNRVLLAGDGLFTLPQPCSIACSSADGTRIGWVSANERNPVAVCAKRSRDGSLESPQPVFKDARAIGSMVMSARGDILVASASTGPNFGRNTLQACSTSKGEILAELWDGPNTSLLASQFTLCDGDYRLVGMSKRATRRVPFVWDLATGERTFLDLSAPPKGLLALNWSPSGQRLLLCHANRRPTVHIIDLKTGRSAEILLPTDLRVHLGPIWPAFLTEQEILALRIDVVHRHSLIVLNADTGEFVRTALELDSLR